MRVKDFDTETFRLMEESDKLPVLIGPINRTAMYEWEVRARVFPEHDPSPWIWRAESIALDRAHEKYSRFRTQYLQDCDPSYLSNRNYNPPQNVYDCTRTIDTLEGDWYEHHNCPKYKGQQRDHTTLPPLV